MVFFADVDAKQKADVIRNGKGNVYMGLSKDDSDVLWQAVQERKSYSPVPIVHRIPHRDIKLRTDVDYR